MFDNEIDNLGKGAFVQSLTYKKPHKWKETAIIAAIDMEYTEKGLLSVQLSIEGHLSIDYLNPKKDFFISDLKEIIKTRIKEAGIPLYQNKGKTHGRPKTVYLASYYSTAEFSMIKKFWNDASVRNVTQKIVNISFPLTSHKQVDKKTGKTRMRTDVRCSIIDIYHFFMDMKTRTGRKSLEDIADEFEGVKKLGGKYSLEGIGNKTKQYWITHMDKLLKEYPVHFEQYALQDVIITEKLFREYRNKIWGELKIDLLQAPTNGSIATSYFRMFEMSPGEKYGNMNSMARRFVLLCSHGAVMVALKRGVFDNMYENDFTGFYSYALANSEFLPRDSGDIISASTIEEVLSGYDGWVKVKFAFPDALNGKRIFPTLPVQEHYPGTKKKTLILFPKTGISYCTVSEVRGAQAFGAKIEFIEGYYYITGTRKPSDFAKKQIALRAEAKTKGDRIGEAIHKSQPNHFTGKLFQHKGGFDLTNAKTIAGYLHCPLEDVVSSNFSFDMEGVDKDIAYNEKYLAPEKAKSKNAYLLRVKATGGKSSSEMRIGACWLPEHHSIILGRARAALWWVVNTYGENVTHLSTDSYHDTKPLSGDIDTPFGKYLIHQTHEKPQRMVINRTKLYTFADRIAHHALHLSLKDSDAMRDLIENKQTAKYVKKGRRTLRSAIVENKAFGSKYEKEMQFDNRFDNKMKIVMQNRVETYEPWENVEEYFAYVEYLNALTPAAERKRDAAYRKEQK